LRQRPVVYQEELTQPRSRPVARQMRFSLANLLLAVTNYMSELSLAWHTITGA
jgi:hypothetical protein